MNRDTKTLTEGAVLAALTVLIATVYLYLPLPLLVAVPVPLLVLTYRHGISSAIPVAFAAAFLAGLVSHMVQGVILVLAMGALGLALGEGLRQGFSPVRTLLWGTIVMAVVSVATFFMTLLITGINGLETMVQSVTQSFAMVTELYESLGVTPQEMPFTPEQYADFMRTIFPAGLVLSSATIAYLTYWLGGLVLGKLGSPVPRFPRVAEWVFPRWLGFGTLGVMLLSIVVSTGPSWFNAVITNVFSIGSLLLAVEGMALAWHFIAKLQVSKVVKIMLLAFLFFAVSPLLIWVGFADNLADYRGLRRGRDESNPKI